MAKRVRADRGNPSFAQHFHGEMIEMTANLLDIARRFNRHVELDRGICLGADQLALLVAIGVNDLIQQKAAERAKDMALQRSVRAGALPGYRGGLSVVDAGPCGAQDHHEADARAVRRSFSGGASSGESADEACQRVKEMLSPQGRSSIAALSRPRGRLGAVAPDEYAKEVCQQVQEMLSPQGRAAIEATRSPKANSRRRSTLAPIPKPKHNNNKPSGA